MALADIVQKILDEAKHQAAQIKSAGEKELAEYKAQVTKEVATQEEELTKKMEQKKKDIDRKMNTMMKMEKRNRILKVKQEMITQVFEKAVEKLAKLSDSEYEKLLTNLAQAANIDSYESGSITPAAGKKSVTAQVMGKVNSKLSVGDEGGFQAGFVFTSKKIEIDSTVDGILRDLKAEIEPEVADILF